MLSQQSFCLQETPTPSWAITPNVSQTWVTNAQEGNVWIKKLSYKSYLLWYLASNPGCCIFIWAFFDSDDPPYSSTPWVSLHGLCLCAALVWVWVHSCLVWSRTSHRCFADFEIDLGRTLLPCGTQWWKLSYTFHLKHVRAKWPTQFK